MSQQTASEDQADMEPDIFDMAKPPSPDASANYGAERAAPGRDDEADTRALRIGRIGDKLRPRHAVAAAVAATAAWIAWPYLFSSTHPATPQSSRLLVSATGMAGATPIAPIAPLQPGAATPLSAPGRQEPDRSPAATTAPAAPEPAARDVALQASIDQLREKLASVESLLSRQAATKGAQARPAHPRAKRKIAAHAPLHKAAAAPAGIVPAATFSLNTVFRNQAWIRSPDLTYVVQPGDVINGIEVIRIDPVARTVLTSQGIIR